MNCVKCEITRAKIKANVYEMLGLNSKDIAKRLTERYGTKYYAIETNVYRENTLPPFKPFFIKEVKQ